MNLQIITYYHFQFQIIVWVEETVLVVVYNGYLSKDL